MDFNDLVNSEVESLPIVGPDGKPFIGSDGNQWTIQIAGPTHPAGFKAEEAMRFRALKSLDGEKPADAVEDYIDRVIDPLVIRTLSWSPIEQAGTPFICNEANARTLYRKSDVVRKQVEGFIYRAANFLKRP